MQIINSDGKTAITYPYTPNSAAAYIFIIVFGLGCLVHIFWLFRLRAWYFVSFIIGCICESFGYYGRVWSSRDQPNVKPYVLQYLLILPAPIFLAATVYMSLGRIASALDASSYTMIRPSRLSKFFIFLDILCFVVQMAGAGMESSTSSSMGETGGRIVTAGVILQILFTAWFMLILFKFHRHVKQNPTLIVERLGINLSLYLSALYLCGFMIMLRNLVRAIQEIEGFYGFVNSHEAFAYLFDAVPMAIVVWAFALLHPSKPVQAVKEGSKPVLPQTTQDEQTAFVGKAVLDEQK